jgi:hypothetical protein
VTSFTLDTNCILDVDENRAAAPDIRQLADAHASGTAHVAVVAIAASERQREGASIQNFAEFRERLTRLGLEHLEILRPMAYWSIAFWDWALWCDTQMQQLEKQIHEILFPDVEFLIGDYCKAKNLALTTGVIPPRWRNAKCDVQALWSHIHHHRDVFVTGDNNFHKETKKSALLSLSARHWHIEVPSEAVSFL